MSESVNKGTRKPLEERTKARTNKRTSAEDGEVISDGTTLHPKDSILEDGGLEHCGIKYATSGPRRLLGHNIEYLPSSRMYMDKKI